MAMKSHEIKRLHTRRQSNVLIFKALDRLVEADWQQHELTKLGESGFLLDRCSWGTMDTYGMGPQRKIFPPRDVSYSGPIFPEPDFLQYPELENFGSEIGLTVDQIRKVQGRINEVTVANRIALERCQAHWATRFSS